MIFSIAQHELLRLMRSGKIWKLLALCQCILGLIFYWLTEDFLSKTQRMLLEMNSPFGITEEIIHPLFAWTTLLFFFITPLLTAYSITQEKKSLLFDLYLTAPLLPRQIILGKFLGLFMGQMILILPVLLMSLLLTMHNQIDAGQFISGFLGLLLIVSASLSLGMFISCLSKEPLIAALATLVTLFMLSLLEWFARYLIPSLNWIGEFALLFHCKSLLSGFIDSRDILYYCIFSAIFLSLSIWRLEKEPDFRRIS
jgi:ABC-2 type transport system permease protein